MPEIPQDQHVQEVTHRKLPALRIPAGFAPPTEKKRGFKHGLTVACAIIPRFSTLPDYFKPSVMRPRGWRPPKVHYGFILTEDELGAVVMKRDVAHYCRISTHPLPNGKFHHPGSTILIIGEHIKNRLGASSLSTLEWEYIIHIWDPTVNTVRVGMNLVSLGCNWTKDGVLPSDEDIKMVLDFFDRSDVHVGWYFDGNKPLWTPLERI
ncbi:hypothetical protein Hypma_010732 [Hypsizygus marmoreus]|uniref:Uncharacterized protein n=1 Tax=Hypsizygus marmoreus TaxID=39966 RepID=A0A369JL97_HYPMA|nr:hypothetical protein Hypma_010732 [Hypsizygus marmoreus]